MNPDKHVVIPFGGMIFDAAKFAIEEAKKGNCRVSFNFNTVELGVYPTSDYRDISLIYQYKSECLRMCRH